LGWVVIASVSEAIQGIYGGSGSPRRPRDDDPILRVAT
jgi:hypothetical protein